MKQIEFFFCHADILAVFMGFRGRLLAAITGFRLGVLPELV